MADEASREQALESAYSEHAAESLKMARAFQADETFDEYAERTTDYFQRPRPRVTPLERGVTLLTGYSKEELDELGGLPNP